MSKKETIRRYIVFAISVFIISLGLSAIVRTNLGTSPISSTPYVFSVNTPLSIGTYLFILCLFFIVAQMMMLGKQKIKQRRFELIAQIPISFIFGLCTDLSMWILSDLAPQTYPIKMIILVAGCIVLALGISLEVTADVLMMGGEYTVQIASKRFKKEFGIVKMLFDITLIILAVISSLLFTSTVVGIREGTIIAALITGPFVKFIMPRINFVRKWQAPDSFTSTPSEETVAEESTAILITISREYGSGGHHIGEMIAKQLGIPFYDKNLIEMVAAEGDFSEEFVEDNEQKMRNPLLYNMLMQDYEAPLEKRLSTEDRLFVAQSKVIRRIAQQGSCVIVGRCANYILDKYQNNIDIFLHASLEYKMNRIISEYGIAPEEAAAEIKLVDKNRREHFNYFTGKKWGDARSYQLTCDSSLVADQDICNAAVQIYYTLKTKQQNNEKQIS